MMQVYGQVEVTRDVKKLQNEPPDWTVDYSAVVMAERSATKGKKM